MNEGIYIAVSGALKQEKKMSVIANNLANVNSNGFKKDQIVFESLLPPYKDKPNLTFDNSRNELLPTDKSNINVAYVGVAGFSTDNSQGSLFKTENTFDLALDGKGYFIVKTNDGIAYTRKGDFHLNTENKLVDKNGNFVQSGNEGGDIILPANAGKITFDKNGNISVGLGLGNVPVGKIGVIDFVNGEKLEKIGNGLLRPLNEKIKGIEPKQTQLRQGFIEQSNVKSVDEMTKMIQTVRAFETYQKVIQTLDQVEERSVNTLGRIG